jgi:hypothetical protein
MHFTHNANGSCGFSGWSAVGFRRSLEHTSYPRAACFGGSQRREGRTVQVTAGNRTAWRTRPAAATNAAFR